jgi:glycosyltransferase involved in cell wall biosynthesis
VPDLVFVDLTGGAGGAQHSLADLAHGLRQIGITPHLIAAEGTDATPIFEASFGTGISFVQPPGAAGVRSALKDLHPDLLIANTATQLRVALIAAPRQRMMFGLRNSAYSRNERLQMTAAAILRPRLSAFAPSRFARSLAPALLRPRVSVVPNPVSPVFTNREPMDGGVASVGVVTSGRSQVKGADLLPAIIRAASVRPFRWRVFGIDPDGKWIPPGSPVAAAFQELRADPSIEIVGRSPFVSQLSSLDFVLVVSRRESFGRVAAEAMSAGRVVVAPRHTALVETLSGGEAGLLYEPGDAHSAAAELVRAYDDDGLRKHLSAAARKHASEHFMPQRVAERFLEVALSTRYPRKRSMRTSGRVPKK